MPSIKPGVVDAQCRSIEVCGALHVWPALASLGNDPDVLDGAAFQDPTAMDLAAASVLGSLFAVSDEVHVPAPDQEGVKAHPFGTIRGGVLAVECRDEGCWYACNHG